MMQKESSSHELIADYYSQHFDELCGYIRRRLRNDFCSEDIAQDVFMRLLAADKLIIPATLPALVYKTANHLLIDRQRRFHHRCQYEKVSRWEKDWSYSGESVYSTHEIIEWMERGMARLTASESHVYRIHIFDGMKVSDICKVTQIKYKSVEAKLGKARKEMRRFLRPLAV